MMVIMSPDGAIIPPPPATPTPPTPPTPAPPKHRAATEVPKDEPPTTNLRGPTPDEILADPLVRTVLDVFEGEVKRIHPRPKKADQ